MRCKNRCGKFGSYKDSKILVTVLVTVFSTFQILFQKLSWMCQNEVPLGKWQFCPLVQIRKPWICADFETVCRHHHDNTRAKIKGINTIKWHFITGIYKSVRRKKWAVGSNAPCIRPVYRVTLNEICGNLVTVLPCNTIQLLQRITIYRTICTSKDAP